MILPAEWCHRLRPDRAAVQAAEAVQDAHLRVISSAIERLPVDSGVERMTAEEWVMPPGETETESVETISDIAARLMGQSVTNEEDDEQDETDSNHMEPQSISLDIAKQSASNLCQFLGDTIPVFTEKEYRFILKLADKVHSLTPAKLAQ